MNLGTLITHFLTFPNISFSNFISTVVTLNIPDSAVWYSQVPISFTVNGRAEEIN